MIKKLLGKPKEKIPKVRNNFQKLKLFFILKLAE